MMQVSASFRRLQKAPESTGEAKGASKAETKKRKKSDWDDSDEPSAKRAKTEQAGAKAMADLTRQPDFAKLTIKADPVTKLAEDAIRQHNRRVVPAETKTSKNNIQRKLNKAYDWAQLPLRHPLISAEWEKASAQHTVKPELSAPKAYVGIAFSKNQQVQDFQDYLYEGEISARSQKIPLFAVYHAQNKHVDCAKFLEKQIPGYLTKGLTNALAAEDKQQAIFNLLKTIFVELGDQFRNARQEELKKSEGEVKSEIGPLLESTSTTCIALIAAEALWVATVGDCQAVLGKRDKPIALSEVPEVGDKDQHLKYKRSVEKRGGSIKKPSVETYDLPKVLGKDGRTYLPFARAVGLCELTSGTHARAKIIHVPLNTLNGPHNFIVMGGPEIFAQSSLKQLVTTTFEGLARKKPKEPVEIAWRIINKSINAIENGIKADFQRKRDASGKSEGAVYKEMEKEIEQRRQQLSCMIIDLSPLLKKV